MAGHKTLRSREDKPKKRKREANDADTKPKRHRQQGRQEQGDGLTGESTSDKLIEADSLRDIATHPCEDVALGGDSGDAGWRILKPMGGRMLDVDPILTEDDRYAAKVDAEVASL